MKEAIYMVTYVFKYGHIMPSVQVYLWQKNYDKLRKEMEKTGKSLGATINELIDRHFS